MATNNRVITGSPGGVYTWVFDITVEAGTLLLGPGGATVRTRYVDQSGNPNGRLMLEGITLTPALTAVPEPGSAMLLTSGVVALAGLRRRRDRNVSPAR